MITLQKRLSGTGVALVTPFNEKGQIDFPALLRLLEHTGKHVDYWVVCGTTGEAATTSQQEKRQILDFVKANNPNKLPIVFGLGGNYTEKLLETIQETDLQGVDALLSVSPYYSKPGQEGIIRHYQILADASPIPIILYNVPGRTSSNIKAATTLQLSKHPNIIGIKEASTDMNQCMDIARNKPSDFLLISGDDALTLPIASIGGEGVIGVTPNVFPFEFSQIMKHARMGNFEEARKFALRVHACFDLLFEEGNPVGVKAWLAVKGICKPTVRLPLFEASESLVERISKVDSWMKERENEEDIINVQY